MDLVGYVRVSRVAGREGDTFISPDVQRERISASALAGGHRVVAWEIDLDEPGSRYDRPGFQAALEAVERGEAGGVAVASLDRFARSVPDAAIALRRLEDAGGILISSRDALDTSTPVGRFARTMMLAIAELELERIRENWRTAAERAIGRGVHISRVPPFGYTRGADGRLEPDPVTGPVVREIFVRRAAGETWRTIAMWLDEAAPRDGAWAIGSITGIVGRRTYLGEAASGEFKNAAAHPALVTRAEWEAAQPGMRRPPTRVSGALLAGLVRCGTCTEVMTSRSSGRRGYRHYVCRKRTRSGVCPGPVSVGMPRLDRHVEAGFLAWLADHPIRFEGVRADAAMDQAVELVEAAERELVTYRDAELASVLGVEAYRDGLRARAEVLDEARGRLSELMRRSPAPRIYADLAERWPTLELRDRCAIIGAAVDAVYVFRGESLTGGGRPPIESRVRIDWSPEVAETLTPES